MDQNIIQGAIPLLSSVLGNNTVAGMMAVFNLALNTINTASETINKHAPAQDSSFSYQQQQQYRQTTFNQKTDDQDSGEQQKFASTVMSSLAMVFGTLNTTFASLTQSETPLTTYILVAVLSYITFRIVYGFVSWIVRSVINLIKMSIIITVVTTLLWFVINVTSPQECGDNDSGTCGFNAAGQPQNSRAQDPISRGVNYLQSRFQAEYHRQQQFVQNQNPY